MPFTKGCSAWNKGLTKDTDPRVAKYGKSGSQTKKGKPIPHLQGDNNPMRNPESARKNGLARRGHAFSDLCRQRQREVMLSDDNPAKRPEARKKLREGKLGDRNPSKRPEVGASISSTVKG